MDEADESQQIDDLISRFSDAEQSLKNLLDAAERLTSARDVLSDARKDMELTQAESLRRLEEARRTIREELDAADEQAIERLEATVSAVEHRLDATEAMMLARFEGAERSLESSQRSLADTASGVFGLTNELKDIARDLKDTAIAFRALDPQRVHAQLDHLSAAVTKLNPELANLAAQQRRAQTLLFVLLALLFVVGVVAGLR